MLQQQQQQQRGGVAGRRVYLTGVLRSFDPANNRRPTDGGDDPSSAGVVNSACQPSPRPGPTRPSVGSAGGHLHRPTDCAE